MSNCKFTLNYNLYYKLQRSKIVGDAFIKMPYHSGYLFCKFPNKYSLRFEKFCSKKECVSYKIDYLYLKSMVCKKEKL